MKKSLLSFSVNNRGDRLKLNILSGVAIKGVSIALSFIFVPLVLSYLTSYKYGIWLTLNSVVSWFSMMDIGLAGGLRLKLQETLAKKDWATSKDYISSTYTLLFFISLLCAAILLIVVVFSNIDFASFFKVDNSYNTELKTILIITIICFFSRFMLQPISVILQADQRDYLQSFMMLMEQILNVIGIIIVNYYTKESLLYASILFAITPILNLFMFSFILFSKRYKLIRPQLFYLKKEFTKPLLSIGFNIFITSLSMVFIVQFNNILIVNYYTPNDVTIYNLLIKVFGSISAFYMLLISPLWSAFGNAYACNDLDWIKRVFKKIFKLFYIFLIAYIVLAIFSPYIYMVWAGIEINDYVIISVCGLYFLIQNIESTYANLFNGTGRNEYVILQRNMMLYGALVNIPLIVLFSGYYGMGLYSVFLANLTALIPRTITYIFKGSKLLNKGLN